MLTLALVALLGAAPDAPTDDVVMKFVRTMQAKSTVSTRLRGIKDETEYDIEDPAHPVILSQKEYRFFTDSSGRSVETLIAVNDGPVLNPETKAAEVTLDKTFGTRFKIQLITAAPMFCRGCYLMSFEPLPDQPPRRSLAEELLTRCGGTLLVDVDSGAILWLHGEMRGTFSKVLGMGKCYKGEVTMTQQAIFGVPMVTGVRVTVHYRKIFSVRHRVIELSFHSFELAPETPQ